MDAPALLRRGLRLEYATLSWNVVGSAIVLAASVVAPSVALAGFGLGIAWGADLEPMADEPIVLCTPDTLPQALGSLLPSDPLGESAPRLD